MTKNSKDMYHNLANYAYIAGLFDGEGCVQYKQYWDSKRKDRPRRYKVWRISMEMSMTDEMVIRWVHEILDVGTVKVNIKTNLLVLNRIGKNNGAGDVATEMRIRLLKFYGLSLK